ncbi:MAG: hypothetical protein ACE5FD_05170 [Anaerolineae bacterium]
MNTIRVKRSIELLFCLLDRADESCWLALEGNLSQFDDRGLTGVVRTNRSNSAYPLSQPNNRVAIPLTPVNVLTLKLNVLPRVGIRAQIRHVFLERDGRTLFAAYNRFQNGAQFNEWATADFLLNLEEQGVIELEREREEEQASSSSFQKNDETFYHPHQSNGSVANGKHRYGSDHPRSLSQDHQQSRVRE